MKNYFIRPGSNSNNHRIYVSVTELNFTVEDKFLALVTAWQDKQYETDKGQVFLGYETVSSSDAQHICALLESVYSYEKITDPALD